MESKKRLKEEREANEILLNQVDQHYNDLPKEGEPGYDKKLSMISEIMYTSMKKNYLDTISDIKNKETKVINKRNPRKNRK
jgi:hypothetical protein